MAAMAAELESFVTQGVSPAARDAIVEGLGQMKMNLTQKPETQAVETGSVREVA
jgi:hypothetical protein